MHKIITFNRLREIFDSINPNVVKEVNIIPKSSQPNTISSFDIEVGYSKYNLWVFDIDDRYTEDGINYFKQILLEYKDKIKFNVTECNYRTIGQSYNDRWVFKL